MHFSTINSTSFWQNEYPIQALRFFCFCFFVCFFFLQDPSALIPHAFSRLSLAGIRGHPSDSRRVSLGASAEGGGGLKRGLCGFPRMKGGQKTLCDHRSQTPRWPWGPSAFCICAFQRCLVMSSPDRDALLHSRILSPGKAVPHSVFGSGFSDCKPFTCLTQAS